MLSAPPKIITRTVETIMTASLKTSFHFSLLITRTTVLKSNTKRHYRWKYQEVGNCVNRPSKRISLSRTRSILTNGTGEWERQLSITWSFSNVGTPLCEEFFPLALGWYHSENLMFVSIPLFDMCDHPL